MINYWYSQSTPINFIWELNWLIFGLQIYWSWCWRETATAIAILLAKWLKTSIIIFHQIWIFTIVRCMNQFNILVVMIMMPTENQDWNVSSSTCSIFALIRCTRIVCSAAARLIRPTILLCGVDQGVDCNHSTQGRIGRSRRRRCEILLQQRRLMDWWWLMWCTYIFIGDDDFD